MGRRIAWEVAGKWEEGLHGKSGNREQGRRITWESGNKEVGRWITWEVGTGNWEEGLHGKWEQGSGKKDYMGKWEQGSVKKDYMGSGSREVGRRITWVVGTWDWEEGLRGKR